MMKFEEAMKKLEEIVERLEGGNMPLEESVEMFEKGIELSKYCSKKLDEVERRITVILQDNNGKITEEDFEVPGE